MSDTQTETKPDAKLPKIRVVALRTLPDGNVRAFVSVKIGPIVLHGFKVVQQPGQRAYVSLPQVEYNDASGKRRFSPLLELPDTWKNALQVAILEHWAQECAT